MPLNGLLKPARDQAYLTRVLPSPQQQSVEGEGEVCQVLSDTRLPGLCFGLAPGSGPGLQQLCSLPPAGVRNRARTVDSVPALCKLGTRFPLPRGRNGTQSSGPAGPVTGPCTLQAPSTLALYLQLLGEMMHFLQFLCSSFEDQCS